MKKDLGMITIEKEMVEKFSRGLSRSGNQLQLAIEREATQCQTATEVISVFSHQDTPLCFCKQV